MAHTKAQKAVKGNRDSKGKRRGVKLYGGEKVKAGNIIVRQVGSKFCAGEGVFLAKDFSLLALKDGIVKFSEKKGKKYVSVIDI